MSLKLGFKALAYPAANSSSDPISPFPCSLVLRCDQASRQATILLVARIPATPEAHLYVLQYDADNLMSGTAGLQSDSNLSRSDANNLLRDKANRHLDIKTLTFSVKTTCPLWLSDAGSVDSTSDSQSFRSFVNLAKATTIHIVFDYKYIRKEHQGMFRSFCKAEKSLRGCPCEALLTAQGLKKASWEVFGPNDTAGAPPAYENSRKRPRLASPSSPIPPQPEHSTHESPARSHTSEKTVPFSPSAADALERALRQGSPGFDFQAEAISAAVSKHIPAFLERVQVEAITALIDRQLPNHLDKALGSGAITSAVTNYLDKTLPTLLPNIIEPLIAGTPTRPPRSPTTSVTSDSAPVPVDSSSYSFDSLGNRYSKLPALTPIGKVLIPHLETHLAEQFRLYQHRQFQRFKNHVNKTLDELESDAYDMREKELAEIVDVIEDQQAGFSLTKEDVLRDLDREADAIFEKRTEQGRELSKALGEHLWDVYDDMCRTVKGVGLQKLIACEVRRCQRREEKNRVRRGVGKKIGRGESRLLGRRREAVDVEWVDC